MVKIENWSIGQIDLQDVAEGKIRLHGKVFGHPRKEDGSEITTSSIIELDLDNWRATTKSGSQYELGCPEQEYIKWLEAHNDSRAARFHTRYEEKHV